MQNTNIIVDPSVIDNNDKIILQPKSLDLNTSRTNLLSDFEDSIELDNLNLKKNNEKKVGTSNLETLMHMIKANIGSGVLAMPLAFKNGGLLLSGVSLWILGAMCVHCMHILLNCYRHVTETYSKQHDGKILTEAISYDEVVDLSVKDSCRPGSKIPQYSRVVVSLFLIFSQLGFCCVYLVFMPTNIKQVVDFYHPTNKLSIQLLMCMILLPLILFCMIKDLKVLAPFSTLANFLMICSLAVILVELCFYGSFQPLKNLDMVASYTTWPNFFSSAVYAFEGISLVLPVHHEMTNKSEFSPWNGIMNIAMALVAIMYFSIGFFGYLKYGNDCMASITLNLPVNNVLFQAVKILFAVAIFITYNLQFYVAAELLWTFITRKVNYVKNLSLDKNQIGQSKFFTSKRKIFMIENTFRTILILFTFGLAISIPRIDLFISLIGALASSTLAIIVPPILDHLLFWRSSNCSTLKLIKNLAILLFGVYIFITGTWTSVGDIVKFFKNR